MKISPQFAYFPFPGFIEEFGFHLLHIGTVYVASWKGLGGKK
jgi:hypothetical protein